MNLAYETAKHWVGVGLPILPVQYFGKKALVKWEQFQDRLPSDTELKVWFPTYMRNLGLIVGNGLCVIDFDYMPAFEYWLPGFVAQYAGGTYMVKTRRGMHVYLHTEEQAKNYHGHLLDIKAERGYVLIPPSIHPSGFQYEVWMDNPILRVNRLEDVLPAEFMPVAESVGESTYPQYERFDDPWEEVWAADEIRSVQEIRARVSILDLIKAEPSDRAGRWYVAKCPFHEDSNPSFWIDLKRGMCGCRKCNIKEMDVANLYARLNRVSNSQAIRELSKW